VVVAEILDLVMSEIGEYFVHDGEIKGIVSKYIVFFRFSNEVE